MSKMNSVLLVVLASIWGASFMFMRVLSPYLGPVLTASFRLLIGGSFLTLVYLKIGYKVDYKRNWKKLFLIGVISQAIPYFLFSYAALFIQSNVSVIMNSLSPLFGLVLSVLFLNDKFTIKQLIGLMFGVVGVVLISSVQSFESNADFFIGIALCLIAAFFYGLSGVYIKAKAKDIDARSIAVGSQLFAGLVLIPFISIFPVRQIPTFHLFLVLIVFGILCSGIANIIYFKIMKEDGPVKALMVTYLMPIFGILWGYLFLSEGITISLLIGGVIIIIGTVFISQRKADR